MSDAAFVATIDSRGAKTGADMFAAATARMAEGSQRAEVALRGAEDALRRLGDTAAKGSALIRAEEALRKLGDTAKGDAGLKKAEEALKKLGEEARKTHDDLGRTDDALGRTGKQADALDLVLRRLSFAAVGYSALNAGKKVVEASDAMGTMRARLDVLTGSAEGAQSTLDAMAAMSLRTRIPANQLTETYLKLANAMVGLNRPASDAMTLTEELAKVVKVSGLSGEEATRGLTQLGQAFGNGRFQGDEFKSVSEQMPPVMRLLQEATGKTAGQLRSLGSDSKITADILATGLLMGAEKVDKQFEKMPVTTGEAFAMLKDQVERTAGVMGEKAGISKAWADVLNDIRVAVADPKNEEGFRVISEGIANAGHAAAGAVPTLISWATWLASGLAEGQRNYDALINRAFGVTPALRSTVTETERATEAANDLAAAWAKGTVVNKDTTPITFGENQQLAVLRLQNQILKAMADQDFVRVERLKSELAVRQAVTDDLRIQDHVLADQLTAETKRKAILEQQNEARGIMDQIETMRLQNRLTEAQADDDKLVARAVSDQLEVRQAVTREMRALHPELAKQLEAEVLIGKEAERTAARMDDLRQKGEQFGATLTDGLKTLIVDGGSLKDTLGNVVQKLADMVFQMTVAEPLAKSIGQSLSQNGMFSSLVPNQNSGGGGLGDLIGGLFGGSGGSMSIPSSGGWSTTVTQGGGDFMSSLFSGAGMFAFADGGVFNSPVALSGPGGFRGVMAEAGEEAIMPLTRGPDGSLGVRSSGGGGNSLVINIPVAGDASEATVSKIDAAVRAAIAQAAPGLTRNAVNAVAAENRANPRYLKR